MGEKTAITWTDATFNPWWGCWKIAPECLNCYADSTANRYAPGHWGRTAPRRFFGDKHWNDLARWNHGAARDGVRRRVFVGSMCDWAEIHPVAAIAKQMDEARARLFGLIRECSSLDFLLLTKRPWDAAQHLPWMRDDSDPWPNVWLGTSAGSRESLRQNVPHLRRTRAAVRFISCEPLLEDIPMGDWNWALGGPRFLCLGDPKFALEDGPVHWLIVGDESAHESKRRPARAAWVRTARDAAAAHGVAFHFKQWCGELEPGLRDSNADGNRRKKIHLPILDDAQHAAFPETR